MSSHSQVFVSCQWQLFFGHQLRVWYICFCLNISSGARLRGITFPPGSWFYNIYLRVFYCQISPSGFCADGNSVFIPAIITWLPLSYYSHGVKTIPMKTIILIREITRSDKTVNLLEEVLSRIHEHNLFNHRHLLGKLNVVSVVLITWTELFLCLVCLNWLAPVVRYGI